ncbi:hypothetical protein [Paenibacillus sp. 481]|uniref:hypothetical protein n=1 Tax=Paenibacillus sp. 481 TaxID=2835869 RepID=UPI001E382E5C|nr:hypothetical protein [Paenibacillus sp. 481]UHA74975.1 hypothetical protein KIK04_08075 [Paenibacillus sp. 481]
MVLKKAIIITSTLALSMLLTGFSADTSVSASAMKISETTVAASAKAKGFSPIAKIDKKYVDAANKIIKQYSNDKAFKLEEGKIITREMGENKKLEIVSLQSKNGDVTIELDKSSGKLRQLFLQFKVSELKGEYRAIYKQIEDTLKSKPLKAPYQYDKVEVSVMPQVNEESMFILPKDNPSYSQQSSQYIGVNLKDKKMGYKLELNLDKMDAEMKSNINTELKQLLDGKKQKFTTVYEVKNERSWEYNVMHSNEDPTKKVVNVTQSVGFDAKTGEVISSWPAAKQAK